MTNSDESGQLSDTIGQMLANFNDAQGKFIIISASYLTISYGKHANFIENMSL
jgi:hypothetical protein